MRYVKRGLLRIFLLIEVTGFGAVYFFGAQGIVSFKRLQQENGLLALQCRQLEEQVAGLKNDAFAWQTNNFKKEKLAREHLQMARHDDQIYYFR